MRRTGRRNRAAARTRSPAGIGWPSHSPCRPNPSSFPRDFNGPTSPLARPEARPLRIERHRLMHEVDSRFLVPVTCIDNLLQTQNALYIVVLLYCVILQSAGANIFYRTGYILPHRSFSSRGSQVIMSRTRSFLDSETNYEYDDSPLVKKLKEFHTPRQSDGGCRQTQAGGGEELGRKL